MSITSCTKFESAVLMKEQLLDEKNHRGRKKSREIAPFSMLLLLCSISCGNLYGKLKSKVMLTVAKYWLIIAQVFSLSEGSVLHINAAAWSRCSSLHEIYSKWKHGKLNLGLHVQIHTVSWAIDQSCKLSNKYVSKQTRVTSTGSKLPFSK